ncbi:hypothetical protein MKW98_021813, partial [Papaver atlanticum]
KKLDTCSMKCFNEFTTANSQNRAWKLFAGREGREFLREKMRQFKGTCNHLKPSEDYMYSTRAASAQT